jgi:hypothetical protein
MIFFLQLVRNPYKIGCSPWVGTSRLLGLGPLFDDSFLRFIVFFFGDDALVIGVFQGFQFISQGCCGRGGLVFDRGATPATTTEANHNGDHHPHQKGPANDHRVLLKGFDNLLSIQAKAAVGNVKGEAGGPFLKKSHPVPVQSWAGGETVNLPATGSCCLKDK